MAITIPRRRVSSIVAPTPAQAAGLPASAIGGAEVQALQTVGETAASLGTSLGRIEAIEAEQQERFLNITKKQNKTDAINAHNVFIGAMGEIENEALATKGVNARTASAFANKKRLEVFKNISENLSPEVRALWGPLAATTEKASQNKVAKHAITEDDKHNVAVAEASGDANVKLGASDPDNLENAKLGIDIATQTLKELKGWNPQQTELYRLKKRSQMVDSLIRNTLLEDPEQAEEIMKDNIGNIDPSIKDELTEKVNTALVSREAEETVDAIFEPDFDNTKDEAAAVSSLPDTTAREQKVKAEANKQLKIKQSDRKKRLTAIDLAINDEATGTVLDSLTLEAGMEAAKNATTNIDRAKLEALARTTHAEKPIITDPLVELEANDKVTRREITTAEQYTRFVAGNMGKTDLQRNLKFVAQGGEAGNLTEGDLRSKFTEIAGIAPRINPTLYKSARDFIVDQIQITGKPATSTNIDDWMGQALLQGFETASLDNIWRAERKMSLVEALETGTPFTVEITDDEKTDIIAGIQDESAVIEAKGGAPLVVDDEFVTTVFLRQEGFREDQIRRILELR